MLYPDFELFRELANQGNLIPIYREILADTITPVSALLNLGSEPYVFLLESVEGGEKWGRYTFLGSAPRIIFKVRGTRRQFGRTGPSGPSAMKETRCNISKRSWIDIGLSSSKGCPAFHGGAVTFLADDMVRFFECLPDRTKENPQIDDAVFLLTDTILIFDNIRHTVKSWPGLYGRGPRHIQGGLCGSGDKKIDRMCEVSRKRIAPMDPTKSWLKASLFAKTEFSPT